MSIIWVLVGMALMGLIVWFTMPLLMLVKHKSRLSYDETVTALSETPHEETGLGCANCERFSKQDKRFRHP